MPKTLVRLFAPCLFYLFVAVVAHGQTATATLSGSVKDPNSAIVPGAAVIVQNDATRLVRNATTDDSGNFTVPLLQPGTYTVTVQQSGFAVVRIPDVVLNVGDQKSLSVQLKVGDYKTEVVVTPDASLVNTSPAVATTIDRNFVQNMPLNGRSFSSLVLLAPGVTVISTGVNGEAGQFSVNGERASTNAFMIDGVSANFGIGTTAGGSTNAALAGAYPSQSAFGGTNNLVSVDALQEFKVQSSTYSASSGRQPGGQITIITRSGTNTFHGSLFEYFRNDALDARNYFNTKPSPQIALRQNNFGGTLGGPIYLPNFGDSGPSIYNGRDRTFFFVSYEGQRLQVPQTAIINVPSVRLRSIASAALKPVLNARAVPTGPEIFVTCNYPADPDCLPAGNKPSGFAPYNSNVSNPGSFDATSVRIDHAATKSLNIFGRFSESPSETVSGNDIKTQVFASTRMLTLGATWVPNSSFNNEFRFNISRAKASQANIFTNIDGAIPIDPALLTSGYSGRGQVTISYGGFNTSILGGDFSKNSQRQINIVDNVVLLKGSHNIRFGIDFRRLNPEYAPQDQQSTTFNSQARVVSGQMPNLLITTLQPSRPQFDNYSLYVDDDWKTTSRLTLSLGLRWEFNPPPTEADNRIPPAVIGINGTDVTNATLAPAGTQLYKPYYKAFAPRFGAAFLLRKRSGWETIVRGGIGVYYDLGGTAAANAWPFTASRVYTPTQLCPLVFPAPPECSLRPGIVLTTTLPTTSQLNVSDDDVALPYSLHWNVAIEQSLGSRQALSVSYVASAGRRLLVLQRLNQPALFTGPRPNPNFGDLVASFNGAESDYQSMQVQYKARFKERLQAIVNYTWAHSIDNVSADNQQSVLDRGNSNFDVRHNFSAAITTVTPTLGSGAFVRALTKDWTFDAIVHAQSGLPVDIASSSSLVTDGGILLLGRPDLVLGVPLYISDPTVPGGRRFNSAAFTPVPSVNGFPTRQGNFGRNVMRGLPLYQFDLALGRSFGLSEKLSLRLKAEIFNVFNHPMFAYGPNDTNFLSSTTFGVPTRTLNTGLGGMNALYQLGGPRSIQLSARLAF